MTCKVMDKHIRAIAPRAVGARFLRLNAQKAPFFVAKLKVTPGNKIGGVADKIVAVRGFGYRFDA